MQTHRSITYYTNKQNKETQQFTQNNGGCPEAVLFTQPSRVRILEHEISNPSKLQKLENFSCGERCHKMGALMAILLGAELDIT